MTVESDRAETAWERRLQEAAASFTYPTTPDIHVAVQKSVRMKSVRMRLSQESVHGEPGSAPVATGGSRRLAVALLVLLAMLVTLLAVPEVRAAVARFLRAGAITIFVGEMEPSPETPGGETIGAVSATHTAVPTALARATQTPATEQDPALQRTAPAFPDTVLATPTAAPTYTPTGTATRLPLLEGPVTLAEAEAAVGFSVQLPAPSTGIGAPDGVYLERLPDGESRQVVVVIWFEPPGVETSALVLYQIGVPEYGMKRASLETVAETEVNGQQAYWVEGEHLLQVPQDNGNVRERLAGNVLVWSEGRMTYRLEGAPSLPEAVRIAQLLVPAAED